MVKSTKGPAKQEQGLASSASKIWLAGLGALAEAEDRGDKFFKSLVKKGRAYEPTLKEPFESASEAFKSTVGAAKGKASQGFKELEAAIERGVASAMKKAGIASIQEVEDLRKEVAKLKREAKGASRKKAVRKKKATKRA